MNQDKKAMLIFELGHLQVFHYQTLEEYARGVPPRDVYWKKKDDHEIHGPFGSAHQAVKHYSDYISKPQEPPPENLIQIDFKAKKRLK